MQLSAFVKDNPLRRLLYPKLLLIMRLVTVLIFAFAMQVSARSDAQKISLTRHNATLEEILNAIHQQTGYFFLYDDRALKGLNGINIDIKKATLQEALDQCIAKYSLCYLLEDKTILIFPKAQTEAVMKPSQVVEGTVTDNEGRALSSVTVRIKNSNIGTVTDQNGHFSIEVAGGNTVLQFSYLGFQTQEVTVGTQDKLNIRLQESTNSLNQLVVVGYGMEKKSDLTGAISTVDMTQVRDRPAPNLSGSLQGLVPGMTVTKNSGGVPGSGGTITIRGATSLNASGPLVLIDGIPGSIDNINSDDVASITVLKDAASTAIYGARAAEGVILIITKKGSFNQLLRISYQANFSLQIPGRYPAVNNAMDNATLGNLAFTNAGAAPLYTQQQISLYKDPNTNAYPNANNTDWLYAANMNWPDFLFRNSLEQSHQLAISGGSENISYRVSGELFDQEGMFARYGHDNFGRKTLRANLSANLVPSKLKLDLGIDYFNSKQQLPAPGYGYLLSTIEVVGPTIPIYNPDGTYARYRQQQNPLQLLKEAGFDNIYNDQLTARINLSWNITNALSVKALGGYRMSYDREKAWHRAYAKYTPKGITNTGYINQPNSINQSNDFAGYSTGQLLIDYDKTFMQAHHFHLLIGSSVEEQKMSSLSAFRDNIPGNELPALNIGSNENWKNGASEGSWSLVSGFSRLNYDFGGKYLLEMNVRVDGSSRFSSEHRWGTFPSVSAGWRISKEPFMQAQNVFSNLKLRLSWGQTGNQAGLGLYDYIPVYDISGYYPFGNGTLGQWAVSPQLASQNRTWETVVVKNIGIDMNFFDNRLAVTADYFEKRNKDMLINIQVPSAIGIAVPTGNYGILDTKGWEAVVNWQDHLSKDFKYSISFNISDQHDKLVSNATPFAKPSSGIINLQGYPLHSIFGYQADGYFQTQDQVDKWATQNRAVNAPGDIKYIDQDGDGKISAPNDLRYIGNTSPRYTFGLNLALKYRNIDFSAFLQGVGKRDYYLDGTAVAPFLHSWDNYSFKIQNDYWTTNDPHTLFPRPYGGGQNYQYSTHWLQNASYVRLKNVQLGYSIPKDLCRKVKANEIRIYFSGADILTWTKLIMYDPEINVTNGYYYPLPESYSIGLNVTF